MRSYYPKAVNYLNQNHESKEYQMCLKPRHGTAHLYVERTSAQMQRGRRSKNKTTKQARKKRAIPFDSVEIWKQVSRDYLKQHACTHTPPIHTFGILRRKYLVWYLV